ncbi:MAG: 4Fe-4S dicluster domain-containing protein [Chloroflexota bacterium]
MLVLTKSALLAWLGQLAKTHRLIAPLQVNGLTLFSVTNNVEDIILDFANTTLSPKEWFFPATETLFTMENGDNAALVGTEVKEKSIIFGIRPCDALGLAVLDKPFLDTPADVNYRQHREATVLIGLACTKASPECFCTSLGTAPDDASHVDILLTPAGDSYSVKTTTEKGKALLALVKGAKDEPVTVAAPPLPTRVSTKAISETMRRVFESPYWNRLADRCLHCNLCSYVCPVCYCFDIRDDTVHGKIERLRTWESCQSAGFTRIAGGYDPRPTKGARLRQRFYHKLLYMPENFAVTGCTGCGRCVKHCPVNIDIREVITEVQKIGASNAVR